jgi:hypothetical protein
MFRYPIPDHLQGSSFALSAPTTLQMPASSFVFVGMWSYTHSESYDFDLHLIAQPDATLFGINSNHVKPIKITLKSKVFLPIFGTFARKLSLYPYWFCHTFSSSENIKLERWLKKDCHQIGYWRLNKSGWHIFFLIRKILLTYEFLCATWGLFSMCLSA